MAEKLTTAATVRVLLDGGYIAEMCPNTGKTRKYTVHKKNDIWGIAPHITPKQFDELIGAGVIESTHESKTNKYGDVYHFYELRTKERERLIARYINAETLSNDINVLEPFELNDDEKCIVFKTIQQQPTADVVERSRLKELIEHKYGDLDSICGCNVNGQWLSVAAIVELIDQAVKE